ncbi:MAG TPA: fatty acid desaturase [Solirubrobacteraceae bacterium]|nr:fatty acid desaturase [Solirubrobacteraceae bacterium]HME03075.1 fatty acid desaturase [Solirubrobacteraceae bacterium]
MTPNQTSLDRASETEIHRPPTPQRAATRPGHSGLVSWRDALAPYAQPNLTRALLDLATSVVPYLILSVAMYLLLDVSVWLALALAVPAAALLVRTFIVFHDCSHGSFLVSRRANAWLGMALGLLLYSPFLRWRHDHAVHHATSGDLERRGVGDIRTLTVREYDSLPWRARLGYRLLRNPLVMFGVGPIVALIIGPRIVAKNARPRMRRNVIATNIALAVLVGGLCWLIGWRDYLLVAGPPALLAGSAGIWLFYVQHQFEDAYWEAGGSWTYADAALRGSSFLKLPRVLQFFSGNIGYHHVHHLSARIPNYNLQRAHDENPIFHDVPTLSLWDGIRAVTLKLWDEEKKRLVTFSEARREIATREIRAEA